jgi:hypothetical protein
MEIITNISTNLYTNVLLSEYNGLIHLSAGDLFWIIISIMVLSMFIGSLK